MRGEKSTLRQAALRVGVAVATAQHWATQAGLEVRHRPKLLVPALRDRVIAYLQRGHTQVATAAACKIRVALVRSVLRSEIGLYAHWRSALASRRTTQARLAWSALRKRYPSASRKSLRARAPDVFARPYRNDRAWLAPHAPPLAARSGGPPFRLDWDARDESLRKAVAKVASNLHPRVNQPIAL